MKLFCAIWCAVLAALVLGSCMADAKLFGKPFRQYADYVVTHSSEFSSPSWSAEQILGEENVYPLHGDYTNAWASTTPDAQREFIEVGLDTPQTVTQVEIYETFNPGAIDTVFLIDAVGVSTKVYVHSAAPFEFPDSSRILFVPVDPPVYRVKQVRIELNSPEVPGWNEIDAVAVTGLLPAVEDK